MRWIASLHSLGEVCSNSVEFVDFESLKLRKISGHPPRGQKARTGVATGKSEPKKLRSARSTDPFAEEGGTLRGEKGRHDLAHGRSLGAPRGVLPGAVPPTSAALDFSGESSERLGLALVVERDHEDPYGEPNATLREEG